MKASVFAVGFLTFLPIAVSATLRYVDASNVNPTPPYTNWSTAAAVIQNAIDEANPGDEVLVTNGIYQLGGRKVHGSLTNRVAVTKAVQVRSVNGSRHTIIMGTQVADTTNGDSAVRCVYLTNGAMIVGFTLTNGATSSSGDTTTEKLGGGIWCESKESIVVDCLVVRNAAYWSGGGISGGTLTNCIILNNFAANSSGGGVSESILYNCFLAANSADTGGGSSYSTLSNCVLSNNIAGWYGGGDTSSSLNKCVILRNNSRFGGGAAYSTLNDCKLLSNTAYQGGGSYHGDLNNCVISNNYAYEGGGVCIQSVSNSTITDNFATNSGGGAYTVALLNSVLSGNSAINSAGGAYSGTLRYCTIITNSAIEGGGVHSATVNECLLIGNFAGKDGAGAYSSSLSNCTLNANSAEQNGGGVCYGFLINCRLGGNSAGLFGGGGYEISGYNCEVIGNSATFGGGVARGGLNNSTLVGNSAPYGGGVSSTDLNNCILYFNSVTNYEDNFSSTVLNYCCTTPLPTFGNGNFTNAPLFLNKAAGELSLQSNSPCINAGDNSYVLSSFDANGNPRVVSNTVDVGAYEYQTPVSTISYVWLQEHGLLASPGVDDSDPDVDGMSNWGEWRCDTDPTNALSTLKMLSPTNDGLHIVLRWQSVNTRTYFLDVATNFVSGPVFFRLRSDIFGQEGTTTLTDSSAIGYGPFFYRVGVQE